ncbi:hypothetical protein GUJ93_ZPchr0002g23705 [Zizania palustris]|uniref:Uncharacterized protein n=1 Tax=Zizania palustris TaxID=103762 RepID=A0A8J5S5K2_ZIZPA|nr:hypothetical protein GUJ93_ZPchr0002g23705 [Zizania palustris]
MEMAGQRVGAVGEVGGRVAGAEGGLRGQGARGQRGGGVGTVARRRRTAAEGVGAEVGAVGGGGGQQRRGGDGGSAAERRRHRWRGRAVVLSWARRSWGSAACVRMRGGEIHTGRAKPIEHMEKPRKPV